MQNNCLIIAEAGCNHNGSLQMALELVDSAKSCGADAVKFQAFKAEKLVTRDAPQANYQVANTGVVESQFDMIKRLELSTEEHRAISEHCASVGITYLCTPFDEDSADMLVELGVPAFKLGSGELTSLPLLKHIAGLGLPMILSTGMSNIGEVEEAVNTVRENGCPEIILLHCVSNYPADPAEVNLKAMKTLEMAFQLPVGYSDHTLGNEVGIAAVALGARVIEKHFTTSRDLPGPDHQASLEPDELEEMIRQIRTVESALGNGVKVPAPSERNTAEVARKSIAVARDMHKGDVIVESDLTVLRPGTGLKPNLIPYVIGKKLRNDIPAGTLIGFEVLE